MESGFEPLAIGLRGIKTRSIVIPILKKYGVDWQTIIGPRKLSHILVLRYEVYKALRDNGYSSSRIGQICNRDHTTVLHSLKKFRSLESEGC
jgi:chromosomal replication initiation ATPase DnaA